MKVGDIVRHVSKHNQGVIVRHPATRHPGHNKIFDVLWFDGCVSLSIYDYDLYKLDKIE